MARKSRKNLNVVKAIEKYKELEPQNAEAVDVLCPDALATAAYIRLSVENNGQETDDSLRTQIAPVSYTHLTLPTT